MRLLIDHREKCVIPFIEKHVDKPKYKSIDIDTLELKRGDYGIADGDKLYAVIERKSLTDYGASIKDTRHNNRLKMTDAREKCGCHVFYLVEGTINPDKRYSGIRGNVIESSMMSLMVRDSIFVIQTRSLDHTAQQLLNLCVSYMKYGQGATEEVDEPMDDIPEVADIETLERIVSDDIGPSNILQTKMEADPYAHVLKTWCCIRGVAIELAERLRDHYKIDVYAIPDELPDIRYAGGRKVTARVYESIAEFRRVATKPVTSLGNKQRAYMLRALSQLPGIGPVNAEKIISTQNLYAYVADMRAESYKL